MWYTVVYMTPEVEQRFVVLESKIDALHASSEKVRKYLLIIMWGTVIAFVLPIFGLMAVVPSFINTYSSMMDAGL